VLSEIVGKSLPNKKEAQQITSDIEEAYGEFAGLPIITAKRSFLGIASNLPLYGAAIYGALFVLAGGLQFWIVDGSEFTNSFVYGGSYAGHLPGSALLLPLRVLFTFVFPVTVTAYVPCLIMLGMDGPTWLPAWLGWLPPVFAGWTWLLAAVVWRRGVRHYTGAGG